MAAMYQLYNKQCVTAEQQHSRDLTAIDHCEDKMGPPDMGAANGCFSGSCGFCWHV